MRKYKKVILIYFIFSKQLLGKIYKITFKGQFSTNIFTDFNLNYSIIII